MQTLRELPMFIGCDGDSVALKAHALLVLSRMGRALRPVDDVVVFSYVNHGRWVGDCVCRGGMRTAPDLDWAVCFDCGRCYAVTFPADAEAIVAALSVRPELNQNWVPGESLEQIAADTAANAEGLET